MSPGVLAARTVTGVQNLTPLGSGRTADVFALDATRVLRRYHNGRDATAEADVMRRLAALGYPVPWIFDVDGPDLVMERLYGPTMLQALAAGEVEIAPGATLLAQLHHQLHALPAGVGESPATRQLHLDLHPDNVILSTRGPVVIDWCNADTGPPDLDVALTAVILAQVAMDGSVPLAPAAGEFLVEFLRRVDGDPLRMLDRAVAMRRADPMLSAAETGLIGAAAALIRSLAGP